MNDKISAIISLCVSVIILIASFFQWWDISFDGKMITKRSIKILFCICILGLILSILLIIAG